MSIEDFLGKVVNTKQWFYFWFLWSGFLVIYNIYSTFKELGKDNMIAHPICAVINLGLLLFFIWMYTTLKSEGRLHIWFNKKT